MEKSRPSGQEKTNPKFEECQRNLGRIPLAAEFLSWTGDRGKEYGAETGKPVPAPNRLHTAEPDQDFEEWLHANAGRPGWSLVVGDGSDQARAMLEANMGLSWFVANKTQGFGIPVEDLAQEGHVGIAAAIDKFEWHRGTKFSSYAVTSVKRHIRRHIENQARIIRIPVHALGDAYRNPGGGSATRVASSRVVSLDSPVGDGDDTKMMFLRDDNVPDPYEQAATKIDLEALSEEIHGAMASLNDNERQVVGLHYGLGGGRQMTMEEIGNGMSVSRQRIQQIEATALQKMKNNRRLALAGQAA